MWSLKVIVLAIATSLAISALIQRLFRKSPDPREPPVLRPTVPFIGHIIGMITNGAKYYSITAARCRSPIYSLPMLSSQAYVVTSPYLASHVQRASSTLEFTPLIIPVTQRMVGFSQETVDRFFDIKAADEKRPSFMDRMHDLLYTVLSPSEIKSVGLNALEQICSRVNSLPEVCEQTLFQWCRELFADVTTFTFYGPENPFVIDPSLLKDYWDWEYEMIAVMASPLPQLTARKAYLAREKLVRSLVEYLKRESYKKASLLVQERVRLHTELGISLVDRARSEFGMLFGALVNGGVTTFWVLNNIFSRPQLLSELREEISKSALSEDKSSNTATIAFEAIKTSCPLLNSVFRETLRLIAPMTSARVVTKDTIIADSYLLRANSVVQIAGGAMHEDPMVWGPDANSFNSRRFLTSPFGTKTGAAESVKATVAPAAFRAFGGGTVYCPGRHFAQMEILSLVAVLVIGWDLEPPESQERIVFDPPKDEKRIPIGVMKPLTDVLVSMKRREGMEDVKWRLTLE